MEKKRKWKNVREKEAEQYESRKKKRSVKPRKSEKEEKNTIMKGKNMC